MTTIIIFRFSNKMLVEVFALSAILVFLYVAVKSTGRPKGMPPGPTPLPIIGNLFEVIKWSYKDQMQIELFEAAKKYGEIFTVDIPGDRTTVVVNSASIAREACLIKKDDFAGRPYKFTWDYLTRGSIDIAIGDFTPTLVLQASISSFTSCICLLCTHAPRDWRHLDLVHAQGGRGGGELGTSHYLSQWGRLGV